MLLKCRLTTFINGKLPSLNVPPESKMFENPVFKDVGLPLLQPISGALLLLLLALLLEAGDPTLCNKPRMLLL
jgi:hypothetical protein